MSGLYGMEWLHVDIYWWLACFRAAMRREERRRVVCSEEVELEVFFFWRLGFFGMRRDNQNSGLELNVGC